MAVPFERVQAARIILIKMSRNPEATLADVAQWCNHIATNEHITKILTPEELVEFQSKKQECINGIFSTRGVSK